MSTADGHDEHRFWDAAAGALDAPDAERGTMMGSSCLRVGGEFAAMLHTKTGQLIVKLHRSRVTELVEREIGATFAPNGRVFKEWMAVSDLHWEQWPTLIEEAAVFARG